jgi:hypothetical protein
VVSLARDIQIGEQMALSILSLPLLWTSLLIVLLLQISLSKCRKYGIAPLINRTCFAAQHYWRSFLSIYLFSYSTLASTLVGYLYCVDIGVASTDTLTRMDTYNGVQEHEIRVIFASPTLSCDTQTYKVWYPVIITLLIIFVLLPPIAFIVLLKRYRHDFMDASFRGRFGILYEPCIDEAYWWTSLILLRRAVFTLVDVFLVVLPVYKFMIFGFVHLLSLLVHLLIQPYATKFFNQVCISILHHPLIESSI